MIQVLLFILKYMWIAFIVIFLMYLYIDGLLETIKDFKFCFKQWKHPLKHLDSDSAVFIAFHIVIPILVSFVYFLVSNGVFGIEK